MTIVEVIDAHTASLSDAALATMEERIQNGVRSSGYEGVDLADLAVRTCSCGMHIDGFYEYIDHLKAELKKAGLT